MSELNDLPKSEVPSVVEEALRADASNIKVTKQDGTVTNERNMIDIASALTADITDSGESDFSAYALSVSSSASAGRSTAGSRAVTAPATTRSSTGA